VQQGFIGSQLLCRNHAGLFAEHAAPGETVMALEEANMDSRHTHLDAVRKTKLGCHSQDSNGLSQLYKARVERRRVITVATS
jgi:hypothetical protein